MTEEEKKIKSIKLLRGNKKKVVNYYNKGSCHVNSSLCSDCIIKKITGYSCNCLASGRRFRSCYEVIETIINEFCKQQLEME